MSNKINLLLVGKRSFIARNIYIFLKDKISVKKISYEEFKKLSKKSLNRFTHMCNCSISKKYQKHKYSGKNDIDFLITKKIKDMNINFIFLSTRKIYPSKFNLVESSTCRPKENYSINKLKTERKIKKILPNNFCILRISNLIGKNKFIPKSRKISQTFIQNYQILKKRKKNYYENHAKDFLSMKQFTKIFYKIINLNLRGTYNVSLGKKVFISEILKALNKNKNPKNFIKIKIKKRDSFYLNNKKLLKRIKVNLSKKDLLKFCQTI
tara:strand:- start:1153 stop:1953 length:801 start_codon:yes stop_codon:yes gene_type:complete